VNSDIDKFSNNTVTLSGGGQPTLNTTNDIVADEGDFISFVLESLSTVVSNTVKLVGDVGDDFIFFQLTSVSSVNGNLFEMDGGVGDDVFLIRLDVSTWSNNIFNVDGGAG